MMAAVPRPAFMARFAALLGVIAAPTIAAPTIVVGQDSAGVSIEYIAHASFVIQSPSGTRLLVDPFASRVWLGYDFPSEWEADAVAITHPHYDHDGGEFRGLDVPWSSTHAVFRDPGRFNVGDIQMLGVRGKHVDPYGKEFGQRNTVWVLEIAGVRIVHLGDNGPLTPEMVESIGPVDVLLMPADGDEHILSDEQTERVLEQLDPHVVIPMHYRIPELEPADGPSDLGEIGPWLEGRAGVQVMEGNAWDTSNMAALPRGTIIVLQYSASVARPTG
jgi:L-ascorbate metabolism protein UlaG (beta-lactamase superfamily)